jgi:hypothetical protein
MRLSVVEQFARWLTEAHSQNVWLESAEISVYVRRSLRHLGDAKLRSCLYIENISQPDSERGKGYFRAFMIEAERHPECYDFIYVENILNPELLKMLLKHGYSKVRSHKRDSGPPSATKELAI